MVATELPSYEPTQITGIDLESSGLRRSQLEIDTQKLLHIETSGFPIDDPWSEYYREVLSTLRQEGFFDGTDILELGIGDARNIRELFASTIPKSITGVDTESNRLDAAWVNISSDSIPDSCPTKLYNCGAEEFLRYWKSLGIEKFPDRVLMCLPQSPEGIDPADVYQANPLIAPFRHWDMYGLTLNAAVLGYMRPLSTRDTKIVMILSDRVPEKIRRNLIQSMGWRIEEEIKTDRPVQQDPDTGIQYVRYYDDGKRFWEETDDGYQPLVAEEAEKRRQLSMRNSTGRDKLNVFHHLSVYVLSSGDTLEAKEIRYGFGKVNFFRTTESWSLPFFFMPDPAEFRDYQANILGITSAGQILDYAALLGKKLNRLDLIDFNPAQNLWVAYLLYKTLDFKRDRIGYRQYMTNPSLSMEEVRKDLERAIGYFKLDSYLRDFPELDLDQLARSFICPIFTDKLEKTLFTVPLDLRTEVNFNYYFLLRDDLFNSLFDIVKDSRTYFHQGPIEHFSPKEEVIYHGIYLSDVHPWTDQDALLANIDNLLVTGGQILFPTHGFDCMGMFDYAQKDRPFEERIHATGNFVGAETTGPFAQQYQRARQFLGYQNDENWRNFVMTGPWNFPFKQNVPAVYTKM